MTDQAKCIFCGHPTVYERRPDGHVTAWGGSRIPKHTEGNFCANPQCDSYGEKVATK